MEGALIILDAEGKYVDANERALDILGVTLEQLRAADATTFAPSPPDPDEAAAFRAAWEAAGSPDITGETTIVRPDGRRRRLRYAITRRPDGTFAAAMEPTPNSIDDQPTVVTVGAAIAAWRAAESRLDRLDPSSPEWAEVQQEIAWLRDRHAKLFALHKDRG
jgi:PAS domain S-box-containing protein